MQLIIICKVSGEYRMVSSEWLVVNGQWVIKQKKKLKKIKNKETKNKTLLIMSFRQQQKSDDQ